MAIRNNSKNNLFLTRDFFGEFRDEFLKVLVWAHSWAQMTARGSQDQVTVVFY